LRHAEVPVGLTLKSDDKLLDFYATNLIIVHSLHFLESVLVM